MVTKAADAMIDAAAALGRWDELEAAVDIKITEQQEFVAVWEERVRSQGEARKKIQGENFLSVTQMEALAGVKQPQVSR